MTKEQLIAVLNEQAQRQVQLLEVEQVTAYLPDGGEITIALKDLITYQPDMQVLIWRGEEDGKLHQLHGATLHAVLSVSEVARPRSQSLIFPGA